MCRANERHAVPPPVASNSGDLRGTRRSTVGARAGSRAFSFALVLYATALVFAQDWNGVLYQHPAIGYLTRPATDRVGALGRAIADGARTLPRDPRTGYLRPILDALGVPAESQLLV